VYVGGTTNFSKRKCAHKNCTRDINHSKYHLKIYQIIRENGGWDNWSMIEIEKYPCKDHNESLARERHWLESLNANMNVNIPGRTQNENAREWNKRNLEKVQNYHKQRYIDNEDRLKSRVLCDCGCTTTLGNLTRHKLSRKHIKLLESK
jgi:hypothetical protein